MGPLWLALAALAAALFAWLLHRRSVARRQECRRRFADFLARRRPELSLVETAPGRWRLDGAGGPLASVDARALTRAAGGDDEERRQRLFLAVAAAASDGPRPFSDDFDLKHHGARLLPRLADEGLELLALEPRAVRHADDGAGGLATIYLVDGEPDPAYLADEHLTAAGIDARDAHGVAMAVLRQRFDEAAARAALAGGEAVAIAPEDGCGGSRLLLLPEALRDGETLFAAAPAPALLLAAADRGALERALEQAGEPAPPLPPAVFRITAGGLTKES